MSVGSHTVNHPDLEYSSHDVANTELIDSKVFDNLYIKRHLSFVIRQDAIILKLQDLLRQQAKAWFDD